MHTQDVAPAAWTRRHTLYLVGAVALYAVATTIGHQFSVWNGYVDLEVYRAGARTWLDGHPLYGAMPAVQDGKSLPFTYPPLAAFCFAPLATMSQLGAQWVMYASSVISLAVVLWLVLVRVRPRIDRVLAASIVIAAVAAFQFVEPIRTTLGFGQVNLVLMLVVVLDTLVRSPWWPRGLLIGIAVTIKLTPAAYILYFVLRRDYKAAATMIAGTVGAIAFGFIFLPSDSTEYWLHTLRETDRIGAPHYANNQSLKGFAARLGMSQTPTTIVWLALSLIALVLTVIWMRRLLRAGENMTALMVNALLVLLISPVSWTHHWVWVAPALFIAIGAITDGALGHGLRNRWFIAATALVFVTYSIGPSWLLPRADNREFGWNWWQDILGNSYVLIGVAILIAGVLIHRPRPANTHASELPTAL